MFGLSNPSPFFVGTWRLPVGIPEPRKNVKEKPWWWLLLGRGTSQMIVEKRCREMWWITPNREAIEHWSGEQLARVYPWWVFVILLRIPSRSTTMHHVWGQKKRSMFLRVHGHHTKNAFNIRVHYVSAAFYTYYTHFHPTYFTQTWSKICETSTASWHVLFCIGPTSKDHWQWPFKDLVFS